MIQGRADLLGALRKLCHSYFFLGGGGGGGGVSGGYERMNETHLSVFHSISNCARVSSAVRNAFHPFLSRARDFTTFTLHDLTIFYVERATAPHYNKLSFMFS